MILDIKSKTLWNKLVGLVKVQWRHPKYSELTCEPESKMREHYPELLATTGFENKV